MPAWPPVDRNDMRRYLRVLAWAYLLETLGEAAYRKAWASDTVRNGKDGNYSRIPRRR